MTPVDIAIHDLPAEVSPTRIRISGCWSDDNFLIVPGEMDEAGTLHAGGPSEPVYPCVARVMYYDGAQVMVSPPIEVAAAGAFDTRWADLQPVAAVDVGTLAWMAFLDQGLAGSGRVVTNEGSRGPGRRVRCDLSHSALVPDPGYVQIDGELVKMHHKRFRAVSGPAWVEFADADRQSMLIATLNTDCRMLPSAGPIWVAPGDAPLETVYVVSPRGLSMLAPDLLVEGVWSLAIAEPGPVAVYVRRDRWYSTTLNIPEWFPAILQLRLDDLQPSDPPPGLIE